MRFICAPDSFKESLRAIDAAAAMERGILAALPDAAVDLCPIADGGEGTVEAMITATGGERRIARVLGPLGHHQVEAAWGILGAKGQAGGAGGEVKTAVIEMAAASGLELLAPEDRDPSQTTTFGTGQLIREAVDAGCKRIILGIGGSATNDGGVGMAAALGALFFNEQGALILQTMTGGMLRDIDRIILDPVRELMKDVEVIAACDVDNPLTGPNGASHVYGPQKGATPEMVEMLDGNLAHLAYVIRRDLGVAVEHMAGGGAAGGLGAGLAAFLGAVLQPGASLVMDAVGFSQRVSGCDLCLTGEGRLDGQSLSGKAVLAVAEAAAKQGVDTVALVGSLGDGAEQCLAENRSPQPGLKAFRAIGEGLPAEESMARAGELLEAAARDIASQLIAAE